MATLKKKNEIFEIFVFQCEFEKIKPPGQAAKFPNHQIERAKKTKTGKKTKQDPSLVWDSCDNFWRIVFGNIGEL